MSNWQYANVVPTQRWRSAMTLPKELSVEKVGERYYLRSAPVQELERIAEKTITVNAFDATNYNLTQQTKFAPVPARISFQADSINDFTIVFANQGGQELIVGYEKNTNQYFIDRRNAGNAAFSKEFAARHTAPRIASGNAMDFTLVIDKASLELFADKGLSVMTAIYFPDAVLSEIRFTSTKGFRIKNLELTSLKSMY